MELAVIGISLFLIFHLKKEGVLKFDWFGLKYNDTKIPASLNKQLSVYLNYHSSYYKNLPEKYKLEFERRVKVFIKGKKFVVRNLPRVSDEMYVTLAAYATQISFGFTDIVPFSHFHTILIYPRPYKSTITKKVHKGEVNRRGYIVLSWRDVQEGGAIPNDGYNLALHEMAHALQLENYIQNEDYEFLDEKNLRKLWVYAKNIETDLIENDLSFLRKYAATNHKEFFAVCVENFFERPVALRQNHPDIYETLVELLKQDPIALFSLN